MTSIETFEAERKRLNRLAYRMLGEVTEAEDVVQDAWLRWQGADLAKVDEGLESSIKEFKGIYGKDAARKVKV